MYSPLKLCCALSRYISQHLCAQSERSRGKHREIHRLRVNAGCFTAPVFTCKCCFPLVLVRHLVWRWPHQCGPSPSCTPQHPSGVTHGDPLLLDTLRRAEQLRGTWSSWRYPMRGDGWGPSPSTTVPARKAKSAREPRCISESHCTQRQ